MKTRALYGPGMQCMVCSVEVANLALHQQWHNAQDFNWRVIQAKIDDVQTTVDAIKRSTSNSDNNVIRVGRLLDQIARKI